jgi:transposase
MPKPLELKVTEQQRQELLWHRDHDPKPYVCERCAALLMIADGDSARHVAQHRLYRPRKAETIYTWGKRYRKLGLKGL